MAITEYKSYSRPPLPRNKYGEIDEKYGKSKGTTLFSGTGSFSDAAESSNVNIDDIDDFVGSTSSEDGKRGLVPAPSAHLSEPNPGYNDNVKFLKGNGTWTDIPISRYTYENWEKDGIRLNGNLWVSSALSTNTLNVSGAAHFWELVIDKVRAAGGNIIISPGNFHVDKHVETSGSLMISVDPDNYAYEPWKSFFYNTTTQTGLDGFKEIVEACDINYIYCRRCWQRQVEGTKHVTNEIMLGDMVRCKSFNMENDEQQATNKDYWTIVFGTGQEQQWWDGEIVNCNYIDLFEYFTVEGSDHHYGIGTICDDEGNITEPYQTSHVAPRPSTSPVNIYHTISEIDNNDNVTTHLPDDELYSEYAEATPYAITEFTWGYGTLDIEDGDDLVVLGHLWDGSRQNAILLAAYDPLDTQIEAPAICQYKGIRNFDNLSLFRTNQIAANGNIFTGRFMAQNGGYLIDINERMNLFYTDIQTGLETVGIHLDGEHSTIKLVGSVEVRQNGVDDIDTLTVWDEDGKMRVKISPEEIPAKSNMASTVSPTYKATFPTLSGNEPADYSKVMEHHTWKEFIWSWNHHWQYYTDGNYFKFKTTYNIGTLANNDVFTVTGLNVSILSKAYFKGSTYVSNRGTNQQSISSVIVRLKKNGTTVTNGTQNLTNSATIVVNDESATISYANNLWSDYTASAGTYTLELEVQYNVYASITYTSEQPGFYYTFDYSLTGSTTITKPTGSITRIGRNGLVFNGSGTNQWFYAGNTGMEMKWGECMISLDTTNGLKTSGKLVNYSNMTGSPKQIPSNADIAWCTTPTSTATVKLPDASTYGIGRKLLILGNDYITVQTYSSSQLITTYPNSVSETGWQTSQTPPAASASPYVQYTSFPMSRTWQSDYKSPEETSDTYYKYKRTHDCLVELVCTGTGWLMTTPHY